MTMPLIDLATSGFVLIAVIMRKKIFQDVRESPVEGAFEELSRVKLRRLSRLNTFQRIAQSLPKFLIIPVELMCFVILSNAFRKRTCKHESKRKSSDEIAIILIG